MIISTYLNLFTHGVLYTPHQSHSPNKHVQCTNGIGILCIATDYALKALSYAITLRHQSTRWTCPGGVSRWYKHKTNTVLLCFCLCPGEYLPICPRCHSFSKIFSSILLFTGLKTFKMLSEWKIYGDHIDGSIIM